MSTPLRKASVTPAPAQLTLPGTPDHANGATLAKPPGHLALTVTPDVSKAKLMARVSDIPPALKARLEKELGEAPWSSLVSESELPKTLERFGQAVQKAGELTHSHAKIYQDTPYLHRPWVQTAGKALTFIGAVGFGVLSIVKSYWSDPNNPDNLSKNITAGWVSGACIITVATIQLIGACVAPKARKVATRLAGVQKRIDTHLKSPKETLRTMAQKLLEDYAKITVLEDQPGNKREQQEENRARMLLLKDHVETIRQRSFPEIRAALRAQNVSQEAVLNDFIEDLDQVTDLIQVNQRIREQESPKSPTDALEARFNENRFSELFITYCEREKQKLGSASNQGSSASGDRKDGTRRPSPKPDHKAPARPVLEDESDAPPVRKRGTLASLPNRRGGRRDTLAAEFAAAAARKTPQKSPTLAARTPPPSGKTSTRRTPYKASSPQSLVPAGRQQGKRGAAV